MTPKKLLIMGFGGHARSVADVALACGYTQLLFFDEDAQSGENFLGHPVLSSLHELDVLRCDAFAASGNARMRQQQCLALENAGLSPVSLIAPSASIGVGCIISPGSFVGHQAHVGPMAMVGKFCIINTGAVVEHESSVGDYSHVSVNATIAGRSHLGASSMLGAGAVIIDRVTVGDDVIIGAGAVVVSPISYPGIYIGVPARRVNNGAALN